MADIFDIALGKALDSFGPAGGASGQPAGPSQDRVFDALLGQESGGKQFDKSGAPLTSKAGAIGIAQVMPATAPEAAKLAGLEYDEMRYRTDPEYNKALGRAYYNRQLQDFDGDTARALAAYNAGPQRVRTALATAEKNGTPEAWLQYLPRETQQYVPSILRRVGLGAPAAKSEFVTPTGQEYIGAAKDREKATLMDFGKELAASATEAVGSMVQFGGEISAAVANKVTGTNDYEGFNPLKPVAEAVRNTMTEGGKQARAGANVEGSVVDLLSGDAELPSSVDSWLMMTANGFGSLATMAIPLFGSAARVASLTKAARAAEAAGDAVKAANLFKDAEAAARASRAIGAGTGGAMTGGAAAEDVRQSAAATLAKMGHEELLAQVPAYAEAFNATGDEQSARQAVVNQAAQYASLGAAAFGAAGGYLNARVLEDFVAKKGMARVLGDSVASRTGRAAIGGGVGSVAEGGQETTEKVGQNVGENIALGRAAGDNALRNTAGDFLGGALVGGPVGAVGGFASSPSLPPELKPVADKAAEPNSPLSRAAMAGNAGALSAAAATASPSAPPAGAVPPADTRPPAADDLVQRVRNLEEGMRTEGWLDNLRLDGLESREVLADMALARNVNAPRAAREAALERVETATFFANRDAPPPAPMDSIQNNPDFAPAESAEAAPREVPSLNAVAGALRDPALRGKISDQDRQQLLYLYNLANNSRGETSVRINAAQQALEIVGRYQAPTGTPSSQGASALEQSAPATPDSAAPTSQQNVESPPNELDFLTTAPAPAKAAGPLGGDTEQPAFLRKRANVVRQLVDNGFETVARDGNTFFLTNTKTGQKFQLDGPADAQLARKAIKDRVDALANTAAASPQNNLLEPTEAQIAAGNYKKSDVIDLNGMRIKIENPQGSTRRGTSPDGKQWETKMAHHYGEFQGTVGADGDKLDVFIGPRPSDSSVFVIDQLNKDGSFDEHKVMMGFPTEEAARQGYLANYEPGWTGLGAITKMSVDEFKTWAKSRAAKKPAAATMQTSTAGTAAAPGAAVEAAITQSNFTAEEQGESADAGQPKFFYVSDGGERRKLRLVRASELPKQTSAPRGGGPRPLSQEDGEMIQTIADMLGKQVVFYKAEGKRLSDGFAIPGQPNTLFVASETTINPLAVFGHEFFHTLRETNPEAWNAIAAVVRERVIDPKSFRKDYYGSVVVRDADGKTVKTFGGKSAAKNAKEFVAKSGRTDLKIGEQSGEALSEQSGGELEELVSDLGGNLLNDPTFWGEVLLKIQEENGANAKGIIAKLAALFKRMVARILDAAQLPGYRADSFVKDLDQVRAAFRDAMADYMKSSGVSQRAMAAEQLRAEQQLKKSEDRVKRAHTQLKKNGLNDWSATTDLRDEGIPVLLQTRTSGGALITSATEFVDGRETTKNITGTPKMKVDQMSIGNHHKKVVQRFREMAKIAGIRKSEDRPDDKPEGLTVTGYHFSQQPRKTLSTSFFGTGLRGSARDEIMSSADGRIRERLSFYFDKGTGVRPESGVGGIAHRATLTNIYDADADPLKLKGGNARVFESKVLDNGYSGYLTRLEGTQPGQVILLGKQTITPEVLGPRSRIDGDETGVPSAPAPAPAPIKKGLMSRELNELNVDAIPGATLRAGTLTVPAESVDQANAELERIGSSVRFSPDRETDAERAKREYAEIESRYRDTDQWLKAPNGAPSNLNERQWVQARTPSFKNWFGDWEAFAGRMGGVWSDSNGDVSKVVDENGEPLVVYHGSGKGGFMAFEEPGGEKRGDLGIFATDDEGMAASYVRRNRARRVVEPADDDPQAGDQPGIYALFVNIRNPYESHFEGANWDGSRYGQYQVLDADGEPVYTDDGRSYLERDEAERLASENDGATVEPADDNYETTDDVVRDGRRFGNDGAIIRQVMDDGGGPGYDGEPADVFVAFEPNQLKSADFNGGVFSISEDDIRKTEDRVGDVSLHNLVAERGERVVASRVVLSDAERKAIEKSAVNTGLDSEEIEAIVRDAKAAHPASNGWAPVVFVRAELETDDSGKQKVAYVYENVPYSFNTDADGRALKPGTPEYDAAVRRVAGGLVADVREVYERAKAGDKAASNIIAQAAWYKAMRERLRREFGGLGDLYADLLGATSPNTPVRGNWDNAIDSLRRALRGDFDELMPKWVAWADNVDQIEARFKDFFNAMLERGMSKKAIKELGEYQWLAERAKEARNFPDDMPPAKESGKKYGFNGQNVVRAMIDLWRVVKNADPDIGRGGTAPKALNFSGNLIGFRGRATIDVWAARNLQRNAGRPRIASMAETGVSGSMLTSGDATLQFGFGQDVFTQAVQWVRADVEMAQSDVLSKINDDDLQALVWFVEKEIWTRNNWTSAAGEGGSFEFEADLAGIKDQARVRELRRIADSSVSATSAQKEVAQARIYEIADELEPYQDAADAMAAVVKMTAAVRKAKKSNDGSAKSDRALAKLQTSLEGLKARVAVTLERLPKSRRSAAQVTARIGNLKKEAARLAKIFDRPLPEQLRASRESSLRELARMSRTLDRFILGLSVQSSSEIQGQASVPTDAKQAQVAQEIHGAAYKGDNGRSLMAAKVYSTEGRYGTPERSFDGEFIARDGFNPLPLAAKTFEVAQRERQDSAFVARVLRPDESVDLTRHRPGVEIYFRDSADPDKVEQMMRRVARTAVPRAQPEGESRNERYFRIGGYTVVVDGRRTPQALSGAMPKAVGMRIMYLPEFNARYGDSSWNGLTDKQIVGKMEAARGDLQELVNRVIDRLPGVSFGGLFHYEVDARFNDEYKDAINAYSTRSAAQQSGRDGAASWQGRSVREAVAAAIAGNGAERAEPSAEVPGGEPSAGAAASEVTKSADRAPEAAEPQPQEREEVTPAQARGRRVTYEVEVEDTGEKARLTVDAGEALADYNQRIATIGKLLECLKK